MLDATVVSLIISSVACIISAASLYQNARFHYLQNRAVLLAEFRHRPYHIYLFVKNYGNSPAFVHSIKLSPEFSKAELDEELYSLYGGNPFSSLSDAYFMPGEYKRFELKFIEDATKRYSIRFDYSDTKHHVEVQTITARASSPFAATEPLFNSDSQALHSIGKSLDSLAQHDLFKE